MLSIHLANIKSSGVYRFVFDRSTIPGNELNTIRLVVGYSEKGPFNTVTYVKNASEFIEIYGNISKKLEKYGCFFHRTALQCVAKEPILCLNLKDFKEETVNAVSFDPYASEIVKKDISVEKLFDTSRLWTLSPEQLPEAYGKTEGEASKYITIAACDTDKNSSTVFMRPSLIKGYDVTLRDWYNTYNNGEYPDYLEDRLDTLVSDYLVDVYIFKGKFTQEVASSPSFVNYFSFTEDGPVVKDFVINAYGEKKDALQALSEVEGSGFITRYSGSILPYFKNTDNSWMSIDLIVNNDTARHNIMMFLDEEMLENGFDSNNEEFTVDNINLGGYNNEDWAELGSLTVSYGTSKNAVYMLNKWSMVEDEDNEGKHKWINDNTYSEFTYGDPAVDIFMGITPNPDTDVYSEGYFTYDEDEPVVYADAKTPISVGDKFIAANKAGNGIDGLTTVISIENCSGTSIDIVNKITFNKPVYIASIDDSSAIIRYNHKLTAHAGSVSMGVASYEWKALSDTPEDTTDYVKGSLEDVATENAKIKVTVDGVTTYYETSPVFALVYDNASNVGVYLAGYTYGQTKPKSSSVFDKCQWVNSKLDVLSGKGIREALTNCTDTDYRYIVDSFEGFPEDGLRGRLASLAKEKENAFVISNFPAIKTFAKDTAFQDAQGRFNTKYIASGHNKSKSTTLNVSMPSDYNGASFIAFYTPLKVNDNGLKVDIPSAGVVSNNFMDKFTTRKPYFIVAGPSYGRMDCDGLIGPDFNFTREDLDNLEPMGVNCMVYKPTRGTYINSNQTAKQSPVSALSKINVRELVIYLQDEIADMLQGHQWELNTQTLRDTIKTKADNICENIMANGGLYAYENVCDETNNTPEVIDNEMVVLSTSIEPAKGAGKMVHELTIYRTGGMSSVIK